MSKSTAFADLNTVTFQLTTACNLSCDYCFQDACNVCTSPDSQEKKWVDPNTTAETAITLSELSHAEFSVVFSGGEPLLVPTGWYDTFFSAMDRYRVRSGKTVGYSIQTNISLLKPEIINLFKKHDVHFSVHYDGNLDDQTLLCKQRTDNLVTLCENGFPVSVLVVGTIASLKALPTTIHFLSDHGIRFYRINYVSSQGRGHQVSLIPPALRAEAEFESAFTASQLDFNTRDNVVMNKFLFYHNNVICQRDYSALPRPQKCRAGLSAVYVDVDGLVYPCSFFTGITGPMAKASDLPTLMPKGAEAIALCEAPNRYYNDKCPTCTALPICGEYCALSPVTDKNCMESFCKAQVTLRKLMDDNRDLTELIAKRFIEHKQAFPADMPRSCGTGTVQAKEG
jgi:uncharacterized protein